MVCTKERAPIRPSFFCKKELHEELQRALADPNATAEERAELAKRTLDMAKWTQSRLDELGMTGTAERDARRTLDGLIDDMKPYADGARVYGLSHPPVTETFPSAYTGILNETQTGKGLYQAEYEVLLEKASQNDMISLSEEMEDFISEKPFEEIQAFCGKLSDKATRKWYLAQDAKIASIVDQTASLEDQARQAFELRNLNRTRARDLMKDQVMRAELDLYEPNKTFEDLIAEKKRSKNLTREEALQDIISTAGKTRKSINTLLGLE